MKLKTGPRQERRKTLQVVLPTLNTCNNQNRNRSEGWRVSVNVILFFSFLNNNIIISYCHVILYETRPGDCFHSASVQSHGHSDSDYKRLLADTRRNDFQKENYIIIISTVVVCLGISLTKMFLVPPNETQLELIKKEEFYRPAETLENDVTQLIEWLSKQPHLPNITGESPIIVKYRFLCYFIPRNYP